MKYASLMLLLCVFACSTEKSSDKAESMQTGIHTEDIEYESDGVKMKGYLAYDQGIKGQRPGILVVHEWWGHNDYARKRAEMLAKLGYTALALDMYGEGKQADHPEDAMKFVNELTQNISVAEARFKAALDVLKNHPTTDPEKTAAIGYCFGGGVVLHMARIGADLDAVVSFHGNLASMHTPEPGSIKARILVCNGADDPFAPAEQIDAFKKEMDDALAEYEFISYEGAVHSFTNPIADSMGAKFNLPLAYNAAADTQSWQRMQNLFKEVFAQ